MNIETERLLLRPFVLDDMFDLFAFASDVEVMDNAGWKPHTVLSHSADVILNVFDSGNEWAIELKSEKKVIGSIGLSNDLLRDYQGAKMLGFIIARPYWKHGYGYEAANALLACLQDLSITVVAAYHFTGNVASQSLLRKLGFHYEGHLIKAMKTYDNKIVDLHSYSLICPKEKK